MPQPGSVIIVGAGQAGLQTALSLRQEGFEGALTLIGEETLAPYHRPPLSKKAIITPMNPEQLEIRPRKVLDDARITFLPGRRVEAVDHNAKTVSLGAHGTLKYDVLVLATGVRPRALGPKHDNLFTLRRYDEAEAVRAALTDARHVAVIGGGYIGLEAAAAIRATGRDVTVIEVAERLLARVTPPLMADYFARLHTERGVVIKCGVKVAEIVGSARITALKLSDGATVKTDLVLTGIGNVTDTHLTQPLGMDAAQGIPVDVLCQTKIPGIYAVGDCTRFHSALYGREVRLESVQHAVDHAKAAAKSIVGRGAPYDPVPWFWSDQYDVKLQIAGLSQGFAEAEVTGDMAQHRFSVSYRDARGLLAVDSVNDARSHMLARREIFARAREAGA